MQTDFLIIGQGLSGSLLAWKLLRRGCKVVVIDNGTSNASLVAAGIINPITGMRFAKSPDVDTFLPKARHCYHQLSAFFGQAFYVDKPMLRIFRNGAELAQCRLRQPQKSYAPYLGNLYATERQIDEFSTPFGFIEQLQTGHLLTVPLLAHLKNYLTGQNALRQASFDCQDITTDDEISWQDIKAKQVVFCEGHQATHNPWFSWLPWRPVKGEILTLNHPTKLPDAILNYGHWLLPSTQCKVRVGATFDREHIDCQPTEAGKNLLLKALAHYHPRLAQLSIIDHEAGIRPCTADRYPIIGRHPRHTNLALFNGFGAKGSLQIPWYCERFADYLLQNQPLPATCDLRRYQASHFPG